MATVPLRERKKLRTRQTIVETALRLFADRGFNAVTVEEIAEAAEVAPRTFFRYFESKETVVFSEEDRISDLLSETLAGRPADEPFDQVLDTVTDTLLGWFHERPDARVRDVLIAETPRLRARELAKFAALEELIMGHLATNLGVSPEADPRPQMWAKVGMACWLTAYH